MSLRDKFQYLKYFLPFGILVQFHLAWAQVVYPWELKIVAEQVNAANRMGSKQSCESKKPQLRPDCAEITDDLCKTLWSQGHDGRIEVSDGVVDVGTSKKSEMSSARIQDLKALLDSESRLPPDLREKAKPIFEDLRKALANENDSKDWYRSISAITNRWEEAISDVAEARTVGEHPELKSVKEKDRNFSQKEAFQKDIVKIRREVLDAKYAEHKNWVRVEKVYKQVQNDMVVEIRGMNIPEAQKNFMIGNIQSCKLSLPYSDPNSVHADPACGSTEMNAFYHREMHTFTMCAGYFNSFQSESALYATISHEIGHSIDPESYAKSQLRKSSLSKSLDQLVGAKGPGMPCAEWNKLVNELAKPKDKIKIVSTDSMQPLYDCLEPKGELGNFETEAVRAAAARGARNTIGADAVLNSFVQLAQPHISKGNSEIRNEFYMRPDILTASRNENTMRTNRDGDANQMEIFTQSLACMKISQNGKETSYEDSSPERRRECFAKALQETSRVVQAQNEDWFSYCGQNCSELVEDGLAAYSNENFADWISFRALGRSLERKKSLRERREAAALASVDLCESPGPVNNAPDLAAVEKEHSLESHPESRLRRLSTFNKRNADLLKCNIDPKKEGVKLCDI